MSAIVIYRDTANEWYAYDQGTGYACGPIAREEAGHPDLDPTTAEPRIEPDEWREMVRGGSVWPLEGQRDPS